MTNIRIGLLALFLLAGSLGTQAQKKIDEILNNIKVTLVAPGIVSTGDFEYGTTVSPNGKTMFFTKGVQGFRRNVLLYTTQKKGKWQTPKVAPFSGEWNDVNPYFSKDGNRLYFVSNRPTKDTTFKRRNWWYVARKGKNKWDVPKVVKGKVNGAHDMIYPTITHKGNAYFCTYNLPGNKGRLDIYESKLTDGVYQKPKALAYLNTKASDADPELSPDGKLFAFTSTRKGGRGHYDLYICKVAADGSVGTPINLGKVVNSRTMDSDPIFSPDGRKLYFSSRRMKPFRKRNKKMTTYQQVKDDVSQIENGLMNIYVADIGELVDFLLR